MSCCQILYNERRVNPNEHPQSVEVCEVNPSLLSIGWEACSSKQEIIENCKQFIPTSLFSSRMMFLDPFSKSHCPITMSQNVGNR